MGFIPSVSDVLVGYLKSNVLSPARIVHFFRLLEKKASA